MYIYVYICIYVHIHHIIYIIILDSHHVIYILFVRTPQRFFSIRVGKIRIMTHTCGVTHSWMGHVILARWLPCVPRYT